MGLFFQLNGGHSGRGFLQQLLAVGNSGVQLIQLNLEYSIMNRLIRDIGTNINQLAKISNTNRQAPSAKLLADMSQDVRVMKTNLDELWEETRKNLWQS